MICIRVVVAAHLRRRPLLQTPSLSHQIRTHSAVGEQLAERHCLQRKTAVLASSGNELGSANSCDVRMWTMSVMVSSRTQTRTVQDMRAHAVARWDAARHRHVLTIMSSARRSILVGPPPEQPNQLPAVHAGCNRGRQLHSPRVTNRTLETRSGSTACGGLSPMVSPAVAACSSRCACCWSQPCASSECGVTVAPGGVGCPRASSDSVCIRSVAQISQPWRCRRVVRKWVHWYV